MAHSRPMRRGPTGVSLFVIILIALLGFATPAGAQVKLQAYSPRALKLGQETTISLTGEALLAESSVWTSLESGPSVPQVAWSSTSGEFKQGQIKIRLPRHVGQEVLGLHLSNRQGTSSPMLFVPVGAESFQVVDVAATRQQPIEPKFHYEGASQVAGVRVWLRGTKRQWIGLNVYAARIGSAMDPIIRVLDAEGQEIAFADDSAGLGADVQVNCQLPADGNYVIELRDSRHRGGLPFVLVAQPLRQPATMLPSGLRPGETQEVGLFDRDGTLIMRRIVQGDAAFANPLGSRSMLSASLGEGESSVHARWPMLLDSRPGFRAATATISSSAAEHPHEAPTIVSAPCSVSGLLLRANDLDRFRFPVLSGQTIRIENRARELGLASYLQLALRDLNGKTLAAAEGFQASAETLTYKSETSGWLEVAVESALPTTDQATFYHLDLDNRPTFRLAASQTFTNRVSSAEGAALSIPIEIQRFGYEGPIELRVTPLPEGCRLYGQQVAAGAKNATLDIGFPPSLASGTLHAFRMEGWTPDGQRQVVTTRAARRSQWPGMSSCEAWMEHWQYLNLTESAKPLLTVTPPGSIEVGTRGELEVAIPFQKMIKGMKEPVRVHVESKLGTPVVPTVTDDKVVLKLQNLPDVPAGSHTLDVTLVATHGAQAYVRSVSLVVNK